MKGFFCLFFPLILCISAFLISRQILIFYPVKENSEVIKFVSSSGAFLVGCIFSFLIARIIRKEKMQDEQENQR